MPNVFGERPARSALSRRAPASRLPRLVAGRYDVVCEVVRGDATSVHLALDTKHRRPVALKVLDAAAARPDDHARFDRETRAMAALAHPHVLPLYDSGVVHAGDDREPAFVYHVTPYVRGATLRERLLNGPAVAPDEARRLAAELAAALEHAHRVGVAHLDVRAEHVLLHEGHAVLADFGAARSDTDPDADARADVHALGGVLLEMLAGAATGGPSGDPDPSRLPARTPRALAAVVARALAPRPEDRFATAAELARALDEASHRPRRWRRRWTAGALLGAASAAVTMLLAAWQAAESR